VLLHIHSRNNFPQLWQKKGAKKNKQLPIKEKKEKMAELYASFGYNVLVRMSE
jgi:hypothetical protein